jgi:mRNA-degrading endonuclease RelE of RelBE toxin-antitoxin system
MPYTIEYTESAVDDIDYFKKYERVIIMQGIEAQVTHEPTQETRNRKRLEENTLDAQWEIRIGKYRVFYNVEDTDTLVIIVTVGWKEHNILYIRGKEYQL